MDHQSIRPSILLEGVRYPDEDRLREYLDAGVLTRETLTDGFRASFVRHAQRIALAGPDGRMTYAELDERSDRLGAAFLAMGMRPLERAVFQCGNSQELLLAFFAALKAGIIPICALQAFRRLEISYLGNLAEARMHLVMGDDERFDDVAFARDMQSEVPSLEYIVQARGEPHEGTRRIDDLIASMPLAEARERLAQVQLDPFQVAVFQLSGGSTGVPKIIPRFHNEYLYNMRAVARYQGYTQEEVLFFPTPLMHNLNMGCFFGPILLCGGMVTVTRDIGAESLCSLVRDYEPTWFGVAGPILQRILPELVTGTPEQKARRKFIAPKSADGLRNLTGSAAYHIFGMTEGVIMFTRDDDPEEVRRDGVGKPVCEHDEVRIVEPGTENAVPDGVAGEALFRGPYTIRGYYKSEREDASRFTPDGFYRSGDLMESRTYGGVRYYFFKGRLKDVIDRGGEKINAEEVESVLNRHPAVLGSAVVGMPDRVYGERACAFIVLRPGHDTLTLPELTAWLEREGLAKFKWPERLELIDELPLTASGKLSKQILRERIAAMIADARPATITE